MLLEEELEISEISVLLCLDHIASVSVTGPFHSPSERTGSIEVQPRGAVKMLLLFHFLSSFLFLSENMFASNVSQRHKHCC